MPSVSLMWLDRFTTFVFSITLAFTFCGLFLLPNGKTILSNLLVISIATGLLNVIIGGERLVGLIDRRLLWVFLGYAIFIFFNRFVHGDQYGVARNIFYVAIFGFLIPRKKVILYISQYAVIIGGICLGAVSAWQHYNGMYRVEGFTNAILFSQAALALILLNFSLVNTFCKSILSRVLVFLSISALLYSIYVAQSRGVWLALLALFVFLMLKKSYQKPIKYSFLGILAVTSIMLLFQFSAILQQRFNAAVYDINSAQEGQYATSWGLRFIAWESAWKGFVENPVLGVGTNGFNILKEHQVESGDVSRVILDHPLSHTHNQYMQNLVIRGALGFGALLSMLFLPFLWSMKKNGFISAGTLYPIAFAIFGLSDVPLEQQNVLYMFTIGLIYFWFSADFNSSNKYKDAL